MANDSNGLTIEYHDETGKVTLALRQKIERRLERLAKGHRDIASISVAAHVISGANRHQEYEARVVVYRKPSNIASIRKAAVVSKAILEALEAVIRQVRDQRERHWTRNRNRGVMK